MLSDAEHSRAEAHETMWPERIQWRIGVDASVLSSDGCTITAGGAWGEESVTLPDTDEGRQSIVSAVHPRQA